MTSPQAVEKSNPSQEANSSAGTEGAPLTFTNTTTNSNNPAFLNTSFPFAHAGGNPLDPSLLLTPAAAAAVAAVAQKIAQSGAQHAIALPSQTGQAVAVNHMNQNNLPTDNGARSQAEPTTNSNVPPTLITTLSQQSIPPHIALLNAGFSFGGHWPVMNVPKEGAQAFNPVLPQQIQFSPAASVSPNVAPMMSTNFQGMQNNAVNMVAAAAQAAVAKVAMSSAQTPDSHYSNMKGWNVDQLEEHVKLLQQLNQPMPPQVSVLLADARRKEEKRSAKRVANRKSACTSRARKKALVEEMTKTNAKLRRQALILALLPDLVIAMTIDGVITFCSAQVERVLQHNDDDLVGANVSDLLVPSSREPLRKLVNQLVAAEQAASQGTDSQRKAKRRHIEHAEASHSVVVEVENGNQSSGSGSGAELSSQPIAVVSEKSFPLSVVQVQSKQHSEAITSALTGTVGNDAKNSSDFGNSNALSRSLTSSSAGDSGSGEDGRNVQPRLNQQSSSGALEQSNTSGQNQCNRSSSDDSCSSSSAAKRLREANANLERNVRWHTEKSNSLKAKGRHKDDVTGASVTANNASARLSSLQHHPESTDLSSPSSTSNALNKKPSRYESMEEQSSSEDSLLAGVEEKKKEGSKNVNESSDDSGYRESNGSLPSREDTSSSDNEFPNESGRRKRRKPLAPTCTICLIRNDLTTVWCEVTSSIRTRLVEEEIADIATPPVSVKSPAAKATQGTVSVKDSKGSDAGSIDESAPMKEIKELLLCLRPIRDGDKKVDESLRFRPKMERIVDGGYEAAVLSASDGPEMVSSSSMTEHRPPKKRFSPQFEKLKSEPSSNDQEPLLADPSTNETEKSVVESLMLMSNEKK